LSQIKIDSFERGATMDGFKPGELNASQVSNWRHFGIEFRVGQGVFTYI